jgi:hypothetical protein
VAARPRAEVVRTFEQFVLDEEPRSELYAFLSAAILEDAALLELAAQARSGQPPAHMLFAAVQFLLLGGLSHELAAYYPMLGGTRAPDGEAARHFRDLCLGHRSAITDLLATGLTQTNETRRCAYLLPAFETVAMLGEGRPLALVELGPSAGLNMLWDRYCYDYGTGRLYGDAGSPVRITTRLRGDVRPPLPDAPPDCSWRVGVDLHPIDLGDELAVRWLEALIWPEHVERVARLRAAVALARAERPSLIAGNALELLPGLLASAPAELTLCLYHTHVTYQFTPAMRSQLEAILRSASETRTVIRLSCEGGNGHPELLMQRFAGGQSRTELLAIASGHASWVEWRAVS